MTARAPEQQTQVSAQPAPAATAYTLDDIAAASSPMSTVYEPHDLAEARQLAALLAASTVLPKALKGPPDVLAVIIAGKELGLTAMQSVRALHIVEGKVSMSADLMVALCKRRRAVCECFQLVESTGERATYEVKRAGERPVRLSFSLEDAQRAGLTTKDVWRKYGAAMLRARCAAAIARAVFPDLLMGIYDEDEIDDARRTASTPSAAMPIDDMPQAAAPKPQQPADAQVVEVDMAELERKLGEVTSRADLERVHGLLRAAKGAMSAEQIAAAAQAFQRAKRLVDELEAGYAALDTTPPAAPMREPGEEG